MKFEKCEKQSFLKKPKNEKKKHKLKKSIKV